MFRFLTRVHLDQWEEESANFWVSVIPSDGLCAVSSAAADYRQIYVFIKSRDSYRTTESALPWLYRMFYCPTTSVSYYCEIYLFCIFSLV